MPAAPARTPLSTATVLAAAVALADREGIEALTIRALAESLGTRPMSLYHHVAGKEAIVDGMVELVFGEIALPVPGPDWRAQMRLRCTSAHGVLLRHPWAAPLMQSRTAPGPVQLTHHEAVLSCLRAGGLSLPLTAHAYAVLDAFVYGFAFQQSVLPFEGGGPDIQALANDIMAAFPVDAYPTFAEFTRDHVLAPGYAYEHSFEYGLGLILDGLDRASERGD